MSLLAIAASSVDEVPTIIKWVASAGGTAVAGACVWLVYTGRLRLKREADLDAKLLAEMTKDRDEWKGVALRALTNNARLTETSERAVSTAALAVTTNPQLGNPQQ